jgi:hypothetical protein
MGDPSSSQNTLKHKETVGGFYRLQGMTFGGKIERENWAGKSGGRFRRE